MREFLFYVLGSVDISEVESKPGRRRIGVNFKQAVQWREVPFKMCRHLVGNSNVGLFIERRADESRKFLPEDPSEHALSSVGTSVTPNDQRRFVVEVGDFPVDIERDESERQGAF